MCSRRCVNPAAIKKPEVYGVYDTIDGVYDTIEMYQKQIKMKQTAPARMRTSPGLNDARKDW